MNIIKQHGIEYKYFRNIFLSLLPKKFMRAFGQVSPKYSAKNYIFIKLINRNFNIFI